MQLNKITDDNTKSVSYNLAKANINEITFEDSVELGLTEVQNINIEKNELNLLNYETNALCFIKEILKDESASIFE